MTKFNISAQLQLAAPTNVKQVRKQVQQQLQGIDISFDLKDIKNLSGALKNTTKQTDKATSSLQRMRSEVGRALKRFTGYAIATRTVSLFTNTLSRATEEAIAFERELIKISQVTGKTVKQLQSLSNTITDLSTNLGVSSTRLLSTARILSQAGFKADDLSTALTTLAKTELAPTFEDIEKTAEGAIAIFNQFETTAEDLEKQLGAINAVAGKFAVESGDLISVVRRTGGVFKSAGGDLNELIALFTSVRATTRESAESIATGLRTIFTRIQRPSTIKFLEQFGVQLTDLEGKFVGPFEAVKQLSQALAGLEEGDIKFVEIAEELGGFRQIGKVIPLIRQFTTAQEALNVARGAGNSLEEDAQKAQKSLQVQFDKTRERYLALVRSITVESESFKFLAGALLGIANGFATIIESARPLIPLLTTIASIKLAKGVFSLFGNIGSAASAIKGSQGAKFFGFNAGGSVPGAGNKDTVPAVLTPGEFVIKKDAVNKIGLSKLQAINSGQDVKFYNDGGLVEQSFARGTGDIVESLDQANDVVKEFAESFGKFGRKFNSIFSKSIRSIDDLPDEEGFKAREIYEGLATPQGTFIAEGEVGEQVVRHEMSHQVDRKLGNNDFVPFASNQEGTFQNKITEKLKPLLAKQLEKSNLELDEIEERLQNQEIFADLLANTIPIARQMLVSTKDAAKGMELLAKLTEKKGSVPGLAGLTPKQIRGFNSGGFVPGVGNRDTVPAMLTPGEFVIRKDSVKNIGVDTLRQMNAQGLNSGGVVVEPKDAQIAGITLEKKDKSNTTYSKLTLEDDDTGEKATFIKGKSRIPLLFPKDRKSEDGAITLEQSIDSALRSGKGMDKLLGDSIKNFSGDLDILGNVIDVSEKSAVSKALTALKSDSQVISTISGYLFEGIIGAYTGSISSGETNDFDFEDPKGITTDDGKLFDAFFDSVDLKSYRNIKRAEAKKDFRKLGQKGTGIQKKSINAYFKEGKGLYGFNVREKGEEAGDLLKEFKKLQPVQRAGLSSVYDSKKILSRLKSLDRNSDIAKIRGVLDKEEEQSESQASVAQLNSGGPIISPEDTVPALLTPGEFVINKKAARNIGKTNLERMNRDGVVGFNKGGAVGGIQKFNNGGGVLGGATGKILAASAIIPIITNFIGQTDNTTKSLAELEGAGFSLSDALSSAVTKIGAFGVALAGLGLKPSLSLFKFSGEGSISDKLVGAAEKILPEERVEQTQINPNTLKKNAKANAELKENTKAIDSLEKEIKGLQNSYKKSEAIRNKKLAEVDEAQRRNPILPGDKTREQSAKSYDDIRNDIIEEDAKTRRNIRRNLAGKPQALKTLRGRESILRARAGQSAAGGARLVNAGGISKTLNLFRSVGLKLARFAGPIGAGVAALSVFNSFLKAGANTQAKLNAAIEEGNVERAEELAVLNNLSGFSQVFTGLSGAEQRARELFGGKTRSLIEAQAASQALKNKIDKDSIKVAERNKLTLEKLNSSQLSFAEALERSNDIFFGLSSSSDVSSNIDDQIKALDENRSTGASGVLRNIFTLGGLLGERSGQKNLRIDQEQEALREENQKQRTQAFESAFGSIVSFSRIAVKEGKSLGDVLKVVTKDFSLTKEQAERLIDVYKNQQQAQLDNIKALNRFSAGFDPVINRLSGFGVEIDSTLSKLNGTFQPLQDAEKRIQAFASGADIETEKSFDLVKEQFIESGGDAGAFDRAAGNIKAFNSAIGVVPDVFRDFVLPANAGESKELAEKLPQLIVDSLDSEDIGEDAKKELLKVLGSVNPEVVQNAIDSGSGEAIIQAIASQSQEMSAQMLKTVSQLNKANNQLLEVQRVRLKAERDFAESIKSSISLREQAFSLTRESLGRQVTPAQRGSFELQRTRQDIGDQGFTGSSQEIIGLLNQNATERATIDRSTPEGRQQIEELNRQDQALINFTQKKIELTREEIKQSQQKIENEKQAAKSLLSGNVLDFLKRSEASVAASALATGQTGLLSQLNASSVGAGFDLLSEEEQQRASIGLGMPELSPEPPDAQAAKLGEYANVLNTAANVNQQAAEQMMAFVKEETKALDERKKLFDKQSEDERERNKELEETRKRFQADIAEAQRKNAKEIQNLERYVDSLKDGAIFNLKHVHNVVLSDATGRVREETGEAVENALNSPRQTQLGEPPTPITKRATHRPYNKRGHTGLAQEIINNRGR